ncbi:MAG TPA: sigma-70 family RNA polymerase sigma factor [Gemmataceae bacterium]|jgi:RNA polymerase sigma factor (sigma-70 family)|nr:sigma-70 family RNA polymerase sigma factor [Gemmataceae bacterium]
MPTGQWSGVLRQIRRAALLQEDGELADGQLLDHFLAHRDETAFEALVRRHGPMVMGVCRRVLRNSHDAEDAFQATFLVLVRKAASVVPREMVGNWLYGVAYRTALGAKTACARRRAKEREMPRREALDEDIWSKLRPLLDHELSHLPDKYRVPIVLCDLESKSRKEAARQLGWSEGTLSGRLARARVLLAKRLSARGLTLSGGALAAGLGGNTALASVPSVLLMSTVKAATLVASGSATAAGMVSIKVSVLMQGVLRAMLITKIKLATIWLLAVGVVGGGVGLISYPTQVAAQGDAKESRPTPSPLPDQAPMTSKSVAVGKTDPKVPALPRRIEPTDIVKIKLGEGVKNLPVHFTSKDVAEFRNMFEERHVVSSSGTIEIMDVSLFVRGQTSEQVKKLLAHLLKSWFGPTYSADLFQDNLKVEVISAKEDGRPIKYYVDVAVIAVEGQRANAGSAEGKVLARPTIVIQDSQVATFTNGKCMPAIPWRPSSSSELMWTGPNVSLKVTDLRGGRLRLETTCEQLSVERNDEQGSRFVTKGVQAVDIVELGDPVVIDLGNDKQEGRHYVVLTVTETERKPQAMQLRKDTRPRIGQIKIVGTQKIPNHAIRAAIPLQSGAILTEADMRRAEKNLARLGVFEVNLEKNIRPTVTVLETDGASAFKDIEIRVKEK